VGRTLVRPDGLKPVLRAVGQPPFQMDSERAKTIIVTGAASGIGLEVSKQMLSIGYKVCLFDIDPAKLREAENALGSSCAARRILARQVDVRDVEALQAAVAAAEHELGPVIGLVNGAGIVRVSSFQEMKSTEWREVIDINLTGAFNTCQAVIPALIRAGGGSVVNIASWLGKRAMPYYGAYSVSKFGLIGLTQVLALELAEKGIRVNAVCPGIVSETGMRNYAELRSRELGLPAAEERIQQIPLGRLARPLDVAHATAFLLSDQADYITGQAINVTGGLWLT
jgi:NAD(P)-dependent dehydrogenase (short-subunit alcohol dehydrogenase family)